MSSRLAHRRISFSRTTSFPVALMKGSGVATTLPSRALSYACLQYPRTFRPQNTFSGHFCGVTSFNFIAGRYERWPTKKEKKKKWQKKKRERRTLWKGGRRRGVRLYFWQKRVFFFLAIFSSVTSSSSQNRRAPTYPPRRESLTHVVAVSFRAFVVVG